MPSQAAIETYLVKSVLGKITGGSSDLAFIARLAIDGPSSLTGELKNKIYATIPELGKIESGIIKVSDPTAAIKSGALDYLKKQNPALANAISKFNKYKGTLNEITADKRPIVSIKENGETIFIERDLSKKDGEGVELFRFGGNWDLTINKDKEEYILTKKDTKAKDTLKVKGADVSLVSGKVILGFNKQAKISTIKIEGAGSISVGKTNLNNIGGTAASPAEIRVNAYNVIEYASFTATADTTYKIPYFQKEYNFEIKKNGYLKFDPNNNKIEGRGNTLLKFENKIISSEGGSFVVTLADGSLAKIDYSANGVFLDNENIIQATSTEAFSVCIGSRTTTDKNCAGAKPNLKLNYEDNLNDIRSAGKIKYKVGFTTIDAQTGSKTIFEQTPNYNYYFQVDQGIAYLEKDEIKAKVEYIQCSTKGTGKAYQIYQSAEKCGMNVILTSMGIPTTITEFVNIVDKDKKYGYIIGPKGGINVINFNKNTRLVGTLDSNEQATDVANSYGVKFGSQELTSVVIADRWIKQLSNYKSKVETGSLIRLVESLNVDRTPRKRIEGADQIQIELVERLNSYKDFVKNGYPSDIAAREAGLSPAMTNILSGNFISYDGTINTEEMYKSVKILMNEAKTEENGYVGIGKYESAELMYRIAGEQIQENINTACSLQKNCKQNIILSIQKTVPYSIDDQISTLNAIVNEERKKAKQGKIYFEFAPGGKPIENSGYSVEEVSTTIKFLESLNKDANYKFMEFGSDVLSSKQITEIKRFSAELISYADLVPVERASTLLIKASRAIKEAGGISKFTKGTYKISAKYFDDILEGERVILAVRPSLILERGSASLIEERGLFKDIPALARKFGCMSECIFDDAGSAAARALDNKIADNIEGAAEYAENFIKSGQHGEIMLAPGSIRRSGANIIPADILKGVPLPKVPEVKKAYIQIGTLEKRLTDLLPLERSPSNVEKIRSIVKDIAILGEADPALVPVARNAILRSTIIAKRTKGSPSDFRFVYTEFLRYSH